MSVRSNARLTEGFLHAGFVQKGLQVAVAIDELLQGNKMRGCGFGEKTQHIVEAFVAAERAQHVFVGLPRLWVHFQRTDDASVHFCHEVGIELLVKSRLGRPWTDGIPADS